MKRINPKTVAQKVAKEFRLDFNKFIVPRNPKIFAYRFKEYVSITISPKCIMINEAKSITIDVAFYRNQKELIEDVIYYMHGLNSIIAIERDRQINEILDLNEAAEL